MAKSFQLGLLTALILASFLLITNKVQTREMSEYVPEPIINSLTNNQVVNGRVIIQGKSINFSQVKFLIDGEFVGYAQTKMGPLGWQDFQFELPENLSFEQHQLDCVAEYYKNTQSPTTTIEFFYEQQFPVPTIFNPVLNNETNWQQPWIVGLTYNDSKIEIYLDEKLNGEVVPNNHTSGVTSFRYQPQQRLQLGFHVVRVKAISSDNRVSEFSNEIIFEVRQNKSVWHAPELTTEQGKFVAPVPAPTLLQPQNGTVINNKKIKVAGVMFNEHVIQIFVDGKLETEFVPASDESGVTNFDWTAENLDSGLHKIWTRAINSQGQTSGISNILKIIVLPDKVYVSQGYGQVISEQKQLEGGDFKDEAIEGEFEEEDNQIETVSNWWKYLIGLVLLIAIGLTIIWFLNNEDKNSGEKINVKTTKEDNGSKTDSFNEAKVTPKESPEFSEPDEIPIENFNEFQKTPNEQDYNNYEPYYKETGDEDEEETLPPPPPPNSPTLGI